jgi:hypothetical protein
LPIKKALAGHRGWTGPTYLARDIVAGRCSGSGQYSWQWNAAEIEAFFGSLHCGGGVDGAGLSGGAADTVPQP